MASWSRLTYQHRLFLWLLGYSMLLVGCFVIFQYHREKEFKINELNTHLQLINRNILDDKDSDPTKAIHNFADLRISIIDSNGQVIYDNSLDSLPGENHISRKEIAEAIESGSGYTVRRHSHSTGNTYFYSATRGEDGYIVRTAVPYSVSLSGLLRADYGFLWIMGAITLIMCIIGYFATRRIGVTIQRLNRFAAKAEAGERIYDTAPFPKDELGSISGHIVRLYANLQQAIADRDRGHKAALYQQQEKERIKKQLTNNINHELKTPVAGIEVCIETLMSHKEMSDEKRNDFLARCMTNVRRLKHLLADVSLITRMDDAPASIKKETVDVSEIISEAVADSSPVAEAKGFRIDNRVKSSLEIHGNASLLLSVFQNLVDNALSYSGGDTITISAENNVITLCDNGQGIPEEHLPHIFERFYRIDKGRSRTEGGTGLGLSIVKNAILLHGGTITVANAPGGGLVFTITFPSQGLPRLT